MKSSAIGRGCQKKFSRSLVVGAKKLDSGGRIWIEQKDEMRSRGIKSADVADAFCMAFGIQSALQESYVPYDDTNRQEITARHGWEYTSSASGYDDESYKDWGVIARIASARGP